MGMLSNIPDRDYSREEIRLLSLAVDATNRALLILDENGVIVYVNRAFVDLFGYAPTEVAGKRPSELLPGPGTDPATIELIRQAAIDNQVVIADSLFYAKSGREVWVSTSVSPIRGSDGSVRNFVVILADITETKQIQTLQQAVLEAVASGQPLTETADLICRGVEAIAPEVFSSMLLVDEAGCVHPLAGPRLPPEYSAALDGLPTGPSAGSCGTAAHRGQPVCATDIETDPLWTEYRLMVLPLGFRACWSSPIKRRDGRVAGTFAFYYKTKRGPSALEQELVAACLHVSMLAFEADLAKQKIAHLSHFDPLTGLPNRQSFYEKATELMSGSAGRETAFFAMNLDHFKDINDTLGHSVGDHVLVEVAYRFHRLTDSLGIVSRTDSDSFMMAVGDCGVARASALAEKMIETAHIPIAVSGLTLSTSASIGISIAKGKNGPAETYAEQAVTALLQAKSGGRSSFSFYNPEQNEIAKERLILGNALRAAVASNSLSMVYQPKIRLKTMEVIGVEALGRWFDSDLGEIPPGKFIPLAEEIGQIGAIGYWSVREVCRQMAAWRIAGLPVPNVSVNLSPLHFLNRNLPAFIEETLAEFSLPASFLTIEITEGVMATPNQESLATAMALHDIGVALSIDDFGTGFSSLSRLAKLPVKELKLDHSFVHNIEEDPNAQAVAAAVISIGQSLGMTVVAEGVETKKQARLMESLGFTVAQGFLFGVPMTPAELQAHFIALRGTKLPFRF